MSNEELQEVQADVIAQLDELARIVGDVVDRARLEHMSAVGDTGEHRFALTASSEPPNPAPTGTGSVPPAPRKGGRHRRPPGKRSSLLRGSGN